jgi:cell division protein FtsB
MAVMGFVGAICAALLAAGCGPNLKEENKQLKEQVATLQKENVALKAEVTSLKADAEALTRKLEEAGKERQALEVRLRDAEARVAVKPGTKPPLKPRR